MSKWILAGSIEINADKIDITDPCYDNDTWCRIVKEIPQGTYNCYYTFNKNYKRVFNSLIIKDGVNPNVDKYEQILDGNIGVDAGLAGFFINKPDYDVDEWNKFCNMLGDESVWVVDESTSAKCVGFFTSSGWGDGGYNVYRVELDNKIVGYKIEF